MANTRSAAKQARAAVRRRTRNRTQISTVRTSEKKIRSLAKAGNTEEAAKLVSQFQSQIDRAAKKGVVHKNTASRHKQRIAALLKSTTKSAA
jgi:small subunit ribosomal protein S20